MKRLIVQSRIVLTFPDTPFISSIAAANVIELKLNNLGFIVYAQHPETKRDLKVTTRFHFKTVEELDEE